MHALRAAAVILLLASTARAQLTNPDPAIMRADTVATATGVPQRDVFDLLSDWFGKERVEPQVEIKPKTGLQWALLPTFSYNPVYGAAFGAMISAAGRRGSENARYSSP